MANNYEITKLKTGERAHAKDISTRSIGHIFFWGGGSWGRDQCTEYANVTLNYSSSMQVIVVRASYSLFALRYAHFLFSCVTDPEINRHRPNSLSTCCFCRQMNWDQKFIPRTCHLQYIQLFQFHPNFVFLSGNNVMSASNKPMGVPVMGPACVLVNTPRYKAFSLSSQPVNV